jgi:alkanesulfonate monooxygenase SsuD/methylene tetrahydromethanopterin reductase-like flavin-dependent oxidoreductase (luciferase family)
MTEASERPTHPWVAEGQTRVRFAIVGAFLREWSQILQFVLQAEELGFDAYWANDHPTRSPDCWTLLSALAMATTRIRLLSLVSCIYYRSPLLMARQAADVDRFSQGRLTFGMGIGDDVPEFSMLQIPFPPARERQAALEEALQIVHGLWQAAPLSYEGRYFQLKEATSGPKPVQQPHVPILIAGGGERVTLRQVARYADMSNFGPHEWTGGAFGLDAVRRKLDVLRQHCEDIGRDYNGILRSHYTPFLVLAKSRSALESKTRTIRIPDAHLHTEPLFATPDEAIAHYQALVGAGMQYFLAVIGGEDLETRQLLAEEVMPAIRPVHTH